MHGVNNIKQNFQINIQIKSNTYTFVLIFVCKHDTLRKPLLTICQNLPKCERLSPPVITFFPISEFSYKLIIFLFHSSMIKSDNEIGKFSYSDME